MRARRHSAERKRRAGVKLLLCRTKIRKGEIDAKFPVGYWFIGLLVCWVIGEEEDSRTRKEELN